MVVSLSNIPKNSQVFRFITSGKPGRCKLCNSLVEKLEAHHTSYSPQITIKICHNCHHKVHFWPQRLSDEHKFKLLSTKIPALQAKEMIEKKMLGPAALHKLIAPSKSAFIRDHKIIRPKKLKSSHLREVKKVNKEKRPYSVKILKTLKG